MHNAINNKVDGLRRCISDNMIRYEDQDDLYELVDRGLLLARQDYLDSGHLVEPENWQRPTRPSWDEIHRILSEAYQKEVELPNRTST